MNEEEYISKEEQLHLIETNHRLRLKNIELKQRITKAIKWLRDNGIYQDKYTSTQDFNIFIKAEPIDLLDILEGKENDTITLNTENMNVSYRGKDER